MEEDPDKYFDLNLSRRVSLANRAALAKPGQTDKCKGSARKAKTTEQILRELDESDSDAEDKKRPPKPPVVNVKKRKRKVPDPLPFASSSSSSGSESDKPLKVAHAPSSSSPVVKRTARGESTASSSPVHVTTKQARRPVNKRAADSSGSRSASSKSKGKGKERALDNEVDELEQDSAHSSSDESVSRSLVNKVASRTDGKKRERKQARSTSRSATEISLPSCSSASELDERKSSKRKDGKRISNANDSRRGKDKRLSSAGYHQEKGEEKRSKRTKAPQPAVIRRSTAKDNKRADVSTTSAKPKKAKKRTINQSDEESEDDELTAQQKAEKRRQAKERPVESSDDDLPPVLLGPTSSDRESSAPAHRKRRLSSEAAPVQRKLRRASPPPASEKTSIGSVPPPASFPKVWQPRSRPNAARHDSKKPPPPIRSDQTIPSGGELSVSPEKEHSTDGEGFRLSPAKGSASPLTLSTVLDDSKDDMGLDDLFELPPPLRRSSQDGQEAMLVVPSDGISPSGKSSMDVEGLRRHASEHAQVAEPYGVPDPMADVVHDAGDVDMYGDYDMLEPYGDPVPPMHDLQPTGDMADGPAPPLPRSASISHSYAPAAPPDIRRMTSLEVEGPDKLSPEPSLSPVTSKLPPASLPSRPSQAEAFYVPSTSSPVKQTESVSIGGPSMPASQSSSKRYAVSHEQAQFYDSKRRSQTVESIVKIENGSDRALVKKEVPDTRSLLRGMDNTPSRAAESRPASQLRGRVYSNQAEVAVKSSAPPPTIASTRTASVETDALRSSASAEKQAELDDLAALAQAAAESETHEDGEQEEAAGSGQCMLCKEWFPQDILNDHMEQEMADLEADAEQDLPPSSPGPSRAVSAQRQTFTYQSMREETTSIILATDKPVSNPKSAFHFQPEVPTKPLTAVRAAPAVLRPSVPSPPRISNIPPNPRKLPAAHPVPREQEEDLANQLFPPTPPRISAQAKGKARAAPEPHSRDNRGFQGAWQSTSHPPTRSTARQSTAQIVELDEDDIHEDDWQDENESGANVNAEDDDEEIEIIAPQASSAKNGKSRQTAQNASLSTNRRGDLSPPTGSIFVSKLPSPIRNGYYRMAGLDGDGIFAIDSIEELEASSKPRQGQKLNNAWGKVLPQDKAKRTYKATAPGKSWRGRPPNFRPRGGGRGRGRGAKRV